MPLPQLAVPPTQALVTRWQAEQLRVPPVKPSEAQVTPPMLLPSHSSPASILPLPHTAVLPVQLDTSREHALQARVPPV